MRCSDEIQNAAPASTHVSISAIAQPLIRESGGQPALAQARNVNLSTRRLLNFLLAVDPEEVRTQMSAAQLVAIVVSVG